MAKIVFCEDDPMIQKLIRVGLRGEGHELFMASDGEEGLELIKRERPDVVFTDVTMPMLDGYGLAERMKDDASTARIPVIFMTARARGGTTLRHAERRVLEKPFTLSELRARVREAAEEGRGASPSAGS